MSNKKEEIGELAIALSFESQSADKQIAALNKSINRTEKEFKSAAKGVENFENTYQGLDAKIKKNTKQLEDNNKKLEIQQKAHKEAAQQLEKSKEKLDKMSDSVDKNSKEWKDQVQLVQKNADKYLKLSTDIETTKGNISRLSQELTDSKTKFEQLGNKTQTLDEKLDDISRSADLTQSEFNKLGAELNQNGTYFQKLGNEINKLSSEIKSGVSKIEAYENEIDKLSSTLNKQKDEYSQLESKIQTYSQHLDRASNMYGENSSQVNEYRQKLLQLKDSFNTLENEINQNENELKEYRTTLNNTQVEVKELSNELLSMPFDKISSDLKSSGDKLKSVGQSMTIGVTAPITAAGVAATNAGTDFTSAMSKLQATSGIADKTATSYINLEKKALEMGSSTSFSASEAAEGLTYLALAGWDVETQIERIEPVLRAAEAGGMDLARCSDLVTDSMSSASIASEDFATYLDIVAQAQRKSNTSMEQMLEAYTIAGGMFSSLNIPLEESGALLGILANRGTKGSEAGNALISVFSNLITETGQAGAALEAMGISLYDSTGKQRNMVEVLKEMAKKLGVTADGTSNLTEQQQQQYAAMVGGKTQFDTLMKLLSGVSNEYDELHSQLVNSNGALEEMATIMKDNLGGKIDNMKSAIEGSLIEAFKALEPTLEKIVEWITETANWFSNLDEEAQKNIVTIAGVAAAAGPLLMALGQVLIVGGNAVNLFGALKTGGSGNIKMFGLLQNAIKLISGPAGFVALIGMLVALMAKLGDNENKLSDLQEKWGTFGKVIGQICEHMTGTVQLSVGNIGILLSTLGKTILAILKGDFKSIDDIWTEGWAKVENNTAIAMSNINYESSNGIALMREMTEIELNNLTGTFDVALKELPKLTADNAGEMADTFVTRMQGLDADTLTILRGTSDTMAVLFEGIYENMSKEDAHNKFTANLESMAKSGEFTSDKISQDISEAMNLIDKNVMDGSERVKQSAQNMFDNLNTISQFGMDATVENVVNAVNNMSDETIAQLSAMGGHWETLFGGIALTGKDSVGDMEDYIRGRLEIMATEHPEFVSQMKEQMTLYFEQAQSNGSTSMDKLSINVENELSQVEKSMSTHTKNGANSVDINTKDAANKADKNTKEISSNTDKNTKDASNKANINTKELADKVNTNTKQANSHAKTNMDNAAKDVGIATSNMANEAKKGTSEVAKNTDSDMKKANKSVQQSATDMYNGSKKSYSKMADVARDEGSRMYNGVSTSASKMSENARNSATEMYLGVTTSTSKMASKAIADWESIRSAYSRSITGNITITKATINRSISTDGGEKQANINTYTAGIQELNIPTIPKIIDISKYKLSGEYYLSSPNVTNNIGYKNNNDFNKLERKLDKLIDKIYKFETFKQENNIIINEKDYSSPSRTARQIKRELEYLGKEFRR